MAPKTDIIEQLRAQLAEAHAEIEFQRKGHSDAQLALLEQGKQLAERDAEIERLKMHADVLQDQFNRAIGNIKLEDLK